MYYKKEIYSSESLSDYLKDVCVFSMSTMHKEERKQTGETASSAKKQAFY